MVLSNVVIYSLKAAFSTAVLYGFYRFALRKEMHFTANRVFLLLSMLVSVVIPFISFTVFYNVVVQQVAPSVAVLESSQPMGSAPAAYVQPLSLAEAAGIVYVAITGCMLLRLMLILLKFILSVFRHSHRETLNGKTVLVSNSWSQTFSFFGVVVMPESDFGRADRYLLVAHEQVHARQLHSVDLLFAELLIAFQWFNPISYLLRNSLHEVHEYLADRCVILNGADQLSYKRLLLDCITSANMPTLSSSFSAKLSKRRFAMISKTYNTGNQKYRFLLSIPIAVALFAMFSLKVEANYVYAKQPAVKMASTPVATGVTVTNAPQDSSAVNKLVEVCHTLNSDGEYLKDFTFIQVKPGEERTYSFVLTKGTTYCFATTSNANKLVVPWLRKAGSESEVLPRMLSILADNHVTAFYDISETAVYKFTVKNAISKSFDMASTMFFVGMFDEDRAKTSSKDSVVNNEASEDEVFFIVEDMPEFEGQDVGHAREWIQKNLKFPEEIKSKGVAGKVYVSFVVNKEGKVIDVKLMRGLEPSLDKEAIRVVSEMPKWTPGKQQGKAVKVTFTIPVKFE